jgi:cell shape-determining protein MreC
MLIDKPDYVLFNFIQRNIIPVAETAGRGITYPIRLVGRISNGMRRHREVLGENLEIMARLEAFEKISMGKEVLEKEKELLMEKLNMAKAIKYKTMVGYIVRDNSFMENQSFIVENSGGDLADGNIVMSNTGFLLGVITDVGGRYAKIQSLRDGRSNVSVKLAGTNVFGFLHGNGNLAPELKFLSDGDFVPAAGMLLATSGVNGNVPNNIPVGRIESADNNKIRVKLGAELKNQESVVILFFNKNEKYE